MKNWANNPYTFDSRPGMSPDCAWEHASPKPAMHVECKNILNNTHTKEELKAGTPYLVAGWVGDMSIFFMMEVTR